MCPLYLSVADYKYQASRQWHLSIYVLIGISYESPEFQIVAMGIATYLDVFPHQQFLRPTHSDQQVLSVRDAGFHQ